MTMVNVIPHISTEVNLRDATETKIQVPEATTDEQQFAAVYAETDLVPRGTKILEPNKEISPQDPDNKWLLDDKQAASSDSVELETKDSKLIVDQDPQKTAQVFQPGDRLNDTEQAAVSTIKLEQTPSDTKPEHEAHIIDQGAIESDSKRISLERVQADAEIAVRAGFLANTEGVGTSKTIRTKPVAANTLSASKQPEVIAHPELSERHGTTTANKASEEAVHVTAVSKDPSVAQTRAELVFQKVSGFSTDKRVRSPKEALQASGTLAATVHGTAPLKAPVPIDFAGQLSDVRSQQPGSRVREAENLNPQPSLKTTKGRETFNAKDPYFVFGTARQEHPVSVPQGLNLNVKLSDPQSALASNAEAKSAAVGSLAVPKPVIQIAVPLRPQARPNATAGNTEKSEKIEPANPVRTPQFQGGDKIPPSTTPSSKLTSEFVPKNLPREDVRTSFTFQNLPQEDIRTRVASQKPPHGDVRTPDSPQKMSWEDLRTPVTSPKPSELSQQSSELANRSPLVGEVPTSQVAHAVKATWPENFGAHLTPPSRIPTNQVVSANTTQTIAVLTDPPFEDRPMPQSEATRFKPAVESLPAVKSTNTPNPTLRKSPLLGNSIVKQVNEQNPSVLPEFSGSQAELAVGQTSRSETVHLPQPGTSVAVVSPSLLTQPRSAIVQIVELLTENGRQSVEIALNPKELGRVKLAMTATELTMVVSVQAERPETIDLLRRHIDILSGELKRMGYESVAFDFKQGGSEGREGRSPEPASGGRDIIGNADASPVNDTQPQAQKKHGIDVRI